MNYKMSLSEMITYSTVLIRCKYSNGMSGSGTGFIINLCKDTDNNTCIPVLITNNHVVENSIETVFEFCVANAEGKPVDTNPFSLNYKGNAWIHHPDNKVDLCCLLLGEALNNLKKQNIEVFYIPLETSIIPTQEQLNTLSAMEDVVMIGYPIGISDMYNHKPVIRKGITSSHPKKDYQGRKETLLDIAAYPGSSGSPVFILNQGAFTTQEGISVGSRVFFLGVLYGGHEFSSVGTLQFSTLPNIPVPVTRIPINLGLMIKAERVIEFEDLLKNLMKGNS